MKVLEKFMQKSSHAFTLLIQKSSDAFTFFDAIVRSNLTNELQKHLFPKWKQLFPKWKELEI